MSSATNKTAPESATKPDRHGFGYLPCPRCGEAEAVMMLRLNNFHEEDALTCGECDATFSVDEIRDLIVKWEPVLIWLRLAPSLAK